MLRVRKEREVKDGKLDAEDKVELGITLLCSHTQETLQCPNVCHSKLERHLVGS